MRAEILTGDCLAVMPTLAPASVDAIVCDPPYGISFMSKEWDHGVPGSPFWAAALDVAKPGAYLLAAGGTRTFHRLACAIEDAGWEIHDCVAWMYGSGFPKHASKLKPAWEPFVLARRKAPRATPLNIDACRVPAEDGASLDGGHVSSRTDGWDRPWKADPDAVQAAHTRGAAAVEKAKALGRWPANVVLDEAAARVLDEQSGEIPGGNRPARRTGIGYGSNATGTDDGVAIQLDSGGASRFFYCAKASPAERNVGLDRFPARVLGTLAGAGEAASDPVSLRFTKTARNTHPTVKPVDLMRWLCRLVTPPGGLILDPFCGSGSTGVAAVVEGFRFVGIEREPEYAEIARARIAAASAHPAAMPLFAEPAA